MISENHTLILGGILMKRKSMVTLLTCTMLSTALLFGCGSTEEPADESAEAAPATEQTAEETEKADEETADSAETSYKIGYVSKMLTNQ